MTGPRIRPERLLANFDRFSRIGATDGGGVDRQAFTDGDRHARALLAELGRRRGFTIWQDAIANLFLRRAGASHEAPPLLIGSHLDTQPSGGRFDGALGVMAALEVLEALEDGGARTNRDVVVVAWANEEGCRFAPGAMGSRAFAERKLPVSFETLRASDGACLGDELDATVRALDAPVRPLGFGISGYVELHIEQGPLLEEADVPIGIVEGIQGVRWLELCFVGRAAHAGTTPLAFRRDPMRAAVRMLDSLYDSIMPADQRARFTVGRLDARPGSANAIPAEVVMTIDFRHPSSAALDEIAAVIGREAEQAGKETGCNVAIAPKLLMAPCRFDASMVAIVSAAVRSLGHRAERLTSGAFHDALFLSSVAPSAMIFVPSRGGLSHNEAEFTEPRHILTGAAVLNETVCSIVLDGAGPMHLRSRH